MMLKHNINNYNKTIQTRYTNYNHNNNIMNVNHNCMTHNHNINTNTINIFNNHININNNKQTIILIIITMIIIKQ